MIDILLISDQKRLQDILAASGALPDGRLRIAASLHQGMEEISSNPPDILFLQNRLSGLAGYILVRHVREATGGGVTKIILLTEGHQGAENSTADIELLTGVSDIELSDAISEIIGDQLNAPEAVQTMSSPSPSSVPILPDPDVTDTVSLSPSPQTAMRNPLLPPQQPSNSQSTPDADLTPQSVLQSSPPPIQWEKKRLVLAVAVLMLLLAAGLLAGFFLRATPGKLVKTALSKPSSVKNAAAPVQAAASSTSRAVIKPVQQAVSSISRQPAASVPKPAGPLPSFITPTGIDPRYSATNPGWERYTSSAREYKVFRESGTIKAIQVLDRQPSGISPAFFSGAIREVAKVRDYRTVSREMSGDFLVKKGRLSKSAELILYKDRSDKILRAFVIYFVSQETTAGDKGSK